MLKAEPREGLLTYILTQFHVPVSQVDEVLPTIVLVQGEIDLHKRTPLGSLGFANQMHAGFLRRVIGLERIAFDTGTNDVFPCRWSAPITRDDVVQIQVFAVKRMAAILTHVLIPLEDIVACKLDFLLREMVINHQQNDTGNPNPKRNRPDRFRVGLLLGKVMPLGEIIGLEGAVIPVEHNLGMALKQQCQCPSRGADIDRLPEPIKHQHMLVESRTHNQSNCGQATQ